MKIWQNFYRERSRYLYIIKRSIYSKAISPRANAIFILVIRGLIVIGLWLRSIIVIEENPGENWNSIIAASIFFVISIFFTRQFWRDYPTDKFKRGKSKNWVIILISLDVLLVTILFIFSGDPKSDVFLLYFLPLLMAAEYLTINEISITFLVISLIFAATVLFLSQPFETTNFAKIFFVRQFVPRWVFYILVTFTVFLRRRTLDREMERLKTYIDTGEKISQAGALSPDDYKDQDTLQEVLEEIIIAATQIAKAANRGSIYLRNYSNVVNGDAGENIQIVATYRFDEEYFKTFRFQNREGAAGLVFKTGEPYLADDFQNDGIVLNSQFNPEISEIKSSIYIPIKSDTEVLGVLCLDSTKLKNAFSEQDIPLLKNLATQAAIVINNARLFRQVHRQLDELREVHQIFIEIIKQKELDPLLHHFVDALKRLLSVKGSFVYLRDSKEKKLILKTINGIESDIVKPGYTIGADEGLAGHVIKSRNTMIIPDYLQYENHIPEIANLFSSVIEAPLIISDHVIGVIGAFSDKKTRPFSEKIDKPILERLATLVSLAIYNTNLRDVLLKVEGVASAMSSQGRVLKPIAGEILDGLQNITEYDTATFQLIRGDQLLLFNRKGDGTENSHKKQPRPISEDKLIQEVISKKGIIILSDAKADIRWENILDIPYDGSWIGIPLFYGEKAIGLITIAHKQPGFYHMDDTDLHQVLNIFANQAAIAINNALNQSYLHALIRSSLAAFVAVDHNGIITEFSEASEKTTGCQREEVLGKPIAKLFFGGEVEGKRVYETLLESHTQGLPVRNLDTSLKHKNAERIPVRFSGTILCDELNNQIGYIAMISDLKDIEAFDHEFKREQGFLAELQRYLHDKPITNFDSLQVRLRGALEMAIDFCHISYAVIFASTMEGETVLQAVAHTMLPLEIERVLSHFNWRKAGLQPQGVSAIETLQQEAERIAGWLPNQEWKKIIVSGIPKETADFFSNLSCGVPVRLADNYRGLFIFGPFEDSSNLLDKADFIKNIAHSITINALGWLQMLYLTERRKEAERSTTLILHRTNTYLTQILGKFGRVKLNIKNEKIVQQSANEGELLVKNLANVVRRTFTLKFTHLEKSDFQFQSYPLSILVQNCVDGFRQRANTDGKTLIIDDSIENLPYTKIDVTFLTMALANLIENAIKYSFRGTYIKIFSAYDSRQATITVQNLGEQMSEEARRNLVEPGQRWTKRRSTIPGMGFGLWDASMIADVHNGKVDFSCLNYDGYYKEGKAYVIRVWITIPLA